MPSSSSREETSEGGNRDSDLPFFLYVSLTLAYGCVNSLTSPVLPDLAKQAGLNHTHEAGSLFIYRGIGSMMGAFFCGIVLDGLPKIYAVFKQNDKRINPHVVLCSLLLLRIISYVHMPIGNSLVEIGVNLGFVAACSNAVYMCGSTGLSWTYGKLLGPRVSLVDAAFGIGGMFAPILAEGLAHLTIGNGNDSDEDGGGLSSVQGYRVLGILDLMLFFIAFKVRGMPNPQWDNDGSDPIDGEEADREMLMKVGERNENSKITEKKKTQQKDERINLLPVTFCALLIFSGDVMYSGILFWFYSHATEQLSMKPDLARTLNTLLWLVFMGVQFLWAFLQKKFPAVCTAPKILSIMLPAVFAISLAMMLPVEDVEESVPYGHVQERLSESKRQLSVSLTKEDDGDRHIDHLQRKMPEAGRGHRHIDSVASITYLSVLLDFFTLPSWSPAVLLVIVGFAGGQNALFTTLLRQDSFMNGKIFGVLRVASAAGNMVGGSLVGMLTPKLERLALPTVSIIGVGSQMVIFCLWILVSGRMMEGEKRET